MFKWAEEKVSSPNGSITITFRLRSGSPCYNVTKNDTTILHDSKLGFDIFGHKSFNRSQNIIQSRLSSHRETIELPWGDNHFLENNYNELRIKLTGYSIVFRAFDEAIAFRYELPETEGQKRISVKDELTEFNFQGDCTTWSIPAYGKNRYEYDYEKLSLSDINHSVHTPFTLAINNCYCAIHEAALYDYGAMNLKINAYGKLQADITPLSDGTKAHLALPFTSPWRYVAIADTAISLSKDHTCYILNDPPRQDFSWVKTLKFIGIWWAMYVGEYTWAPGPDHGATTKHAMEYIDAAVELGIKGLLIEGWNNGWDGDWLENGKNTNFTTPQDDFDFDLVSSYAKDRDIELVGHHETVGFVDNYETQLERAYNYYAAHGVNYIKTGYSGSKMIIGGHPEYHHSQLGVRHYQKTVELAAKKHICLDIHEPIKGTGIERTFPNLLTREGARGQEYESGVLRLNHATVLPFTRLLSGGMDFTPGLFDLQNDKRKIFTTIIRQLAYFVTIYSGMQMAADRPFIYQNKFPELFSFIQSVPTDYEISLPLAGEIGKYFVIARKARYFDEWFVAGVTNENPRTLNISFDFLSDARYDATFYLDAEDAHYRNNPFGHQIIKKCLTKNSREDIFMAPGGGFAIRLVPQ